MFEKLEEFFYVNFPAIKKVFNEYEGIKICH
jgi:hypothetical protein